MTPLPHAILLLGLLADPLEEASALEPTAAQAPGLPPAPAVPGQLPEGEMRLKAETQEQVAKGHLRARGFVDIAFGDMRIQADRVDYYEAELPDGKTSRRLVAEENVVFLRGEERLSGEKLEMDVDTGRGTFTDAIGYVQPGVFVEGRKIERISDQTYRVEGGTFTSCAQPNPRWRFATSSARVEVDDKIVAKNVVFRIKSVPAFYLPIIYYPIREDQRSTGFLFPHFGYSSVKGYEVGGAFFWAMGRSVDQTFYADHYSKVGMGFGHELRYAADQPSRGTFRTYAIKPSNAAEWDYDLDWNALQMLPGRFRATVNVRQYSDLLFQQQYHDNFNMATSRARRAALNIQRSFGSNVFVLTADSMQNYFGEEVTRALQRLPSLALRRFPQKIGRTGLVFGYETRAEHLGFGPGDAVERFRRFDVAPQVSYPLTTTFLQVTPSGSFRYTSYSTSYNSAEDATTALGGPGINRPFFEGSLDVRGPTFSRVFDVGGGYTDRIKHVIGPEVNWLYRTRVDAEDINAIPKYDGIDYLVGTNQIDYGIVQRFLAKRPGPSGRTIPHEFLSIRVGQTYYVQIADGQNNLDPNYANSAFGPGFTPAHLSPILSRIRFRPVTGITSDFNIYYDVNFKQLQSMFFTTTLNGPRGSLLAGWSKSLQLAEKPEDRTTRSNTVRGAAMFQLLPSRLTIDGAANYDFVRKELLQSRARIRFDVQCCGLMAEIIQYNYNQRLERQYRFSIELANVGSIGNFMDEDVPGRRQGLGSYR